MTLCNVKGVTSRDKPTENYHRTLQVTSALQSGALKASKRAYFPQEKTEQVVGKHDSR